MVVSQKKKFIIFEEKINLKILSIDIKFALKGGKAAQMLISKYARNIIFESNDVDILVLSNDSKHNAKNITEQLSEIINNYISYDFISILKPNQNPENPNIIKIADSQVSSRWGNILDFKKVDIIFPNELEARFSLGDQDSGIRSVGTALMKASECKNLVLKLGEKGSMVFRNTGFYPQDFFPLDSFVRNKVDTIGAGDAYLSATTIFYCITKNIVLSSIIGNFAAAIACEQEGNVPITREQIISYIKTLNFN
jgi:bifunctional ADP-heptose synthase (sugar kinase/adenylyltransferase)